MRDNVIDRALAFCEMHECVERGRPKLAQSLVRTYDLELSQACVAEDGGITDDVRDSYGEREIDDETPTGESRTDTTA